VHWPASCFEAAFISLSHSDQDIERTIEAAEAALTD
jgi:glutamate-1-semialdehyde aminotransferase